jgi:hypothetical protein
MAGRGTDCGGGEAGLRAARLRLALRDRAGGAFTSGVWPEAEKLISDASVLQDRIALKLAGAAYAVRKRLAVMGPQSANRNVLVSGRFDLVGGLEIRRTGAVTGGN